MRQVQVIWLIVVACIFARAFVKTGFGDRLALFFVKLFGKTTLSLAYGLQVRQPRSSSCFATVRVVFTAHWHPMAQW